MLRRLTKIVEMLGVNSVPVIGVFAAEWSSATALSVYWAENLIASLKHAGVRRSVSWCRAIRGETMPANLKMKSRGAQPDGLPLHRGGGGCRLANLPCWRHLPPQISNLTKKLLNRLTRPRV